MSEAETRPGKQRLIDAAAELFGERGYESTSIADIAERAGVSRGSVPWHFTNKAGILAAVVDRELDGFLTEFFGRGLNGSEDAVAALSDFTVQPRTHLFFTLLTEALRPNSSVRDLLDRIHHRIIRAACQWLDEIDPQVRTSDRREAQATLALATVIGVHAQSRITPDRVDVAAVYRLLLIALLADQPRI